MDKLSNLSMSIADKGTPINFSIQDLFKNLIKVNAIPTGSIDDNGNNILHYLIYNYDKVGGIDTIETIVNKIQNPEFINHQNKSGETPAVVACALKHYDVVEMLEKHGADLSIKTNNGTRVITATETENIRSAQQPSFLEKTANSAEQFLSSLYAKLGSPKRTETLTSLQISQSSPKKDSPSESGNGTTEQELAGIINNYNKKQQSPNNEESLKTEELVNALKNNVTIPQHQAVGGGSRTTIIGQRMLNSIPDYGNEMSSISVGGENQKNKYHEDTLNYIVDTLKTDKTKRTDEELMLLAKQCKAAIYHDVKEKLKDSNASGLDRAKELYETAKKYTLSKLLKIDIDAVKQRYDEWLTSQQNISSSSSEDEKPKKSKKSKDSETIARESETTDIHINAFDDIKKKLKDAGLDDDDTNVKIYKSFIYHYIKDNNPDANGLERAKLMKKYIDDLDIKTIDAKKAKKQYDKVMESVNEMKKSHDKDNVSLSSSETSSDKPKRKKKTTSIESSSTSSPDLGTTLPE